MKIRISNQSVLSFLPIFFLLSNFVKMFWDKVLFFQFFLTVIGVVGIYVTIRRRSRRQKRFYIFSLVYILSVSACSLINHNLSAADIPVNLFLLGITGIMLSYHWTEKQGGFLYLFMFFFLAARMNTSFGNVLSISSNNYISVLLILAASYFYLPFEWNEKKFGILHLCPAIGCMALSILAKGRGGILSSTIMFGGLTLVYILKKTQRKVYRGIAIVSVILLVIVVFLAENGQLFSILLRLGNFRQQGLDNSIRQSMWISYVNECRQSSKYMCFGVPLNQIPLIAKFNNNPHNSFIYLHAIGGIAIFLVVFFMIITAIRQCLINRQPFVLTIMLTVIVRGMTDKFIFSQYGMPILIFTLIYPFSSNINMKEKLKKSVSSEYVEFFENKE